MSNTQPDIQNEALQTLINAPITEALVKSILEYSDWKKVIDSLSIRVDFIELLVAIANNPSNKEAGWYASERIFTQLEAYLPEIQQERQLLEAKSIDNIASLATNLEAIVQQYQGQIESMFKDLKRRKENGTTDLGTDKDVYLQLIKEFVKQVDDLVTDFNTFISQLYLQLPIDPLYQPYLKTAFRHSEFIDNFISILSHVIRTPITTILSVMSTCINYLDKYEAAKLIDKVNQSELQFNEIIEITQSLIDFVLIYTNDADLAAEPITSSELGNRLQELIKEYNSTTDGRYTIRFSEGLNPDLKIKVSIEFILMALKNILNNAVSFGKETGTVEVNCSLSESDNSLVITIEDNGKGMTEEEIQRAATPFFSQSGTGTSFVGRKGTGLGLGLSSTNKIIKDNGGSLDIQSEPNVGTKITISFPLVG